MADIKDITAAELASRRRPGRRQHPAMADILKEGEGLPEPATAVHGEVVTGAIPPRQQAAPEQTETKPEAKPEAKPEPTGDKPEALSAAEKRLQEVERELASTRETLRTNTAHAETQIGEFKNRLSQMDALERELAERDAALQARQSQLEETTTRLRKFEHDARSQSVESLLRNALDSVGDDSDLDLGQARGLSASVLRPALTGVVDTLTAQQTAALEEVQRQAKGREDALRAELAALSKRLSDGEETVSKNRLKRINDAILKEHPDFYAFNQTPAFADFSTLKPEFSLQDYGTIMRESYEKGDVANVNKVLAKFKSDRDGGRPDPQRAAEVPTGTDSASQPASTKGEKTYTYDFMAELRAQFQRNDITRAQFQKAKDEFLKAEREGRVLG